MLRLTVLTNDEEGLLTDLSSKVRKRFTPKKSIFLNLVFGPVNFVGEKSDQYPNSNSPLFGPIVKKRVGSFSRRYGHCETPRKVIALYWPFLGPLATLHTRYGPKIYQWKFCSLRHCPQTPN